MPDPEPTQLRVRPPRRGVPPIGVAALVAAGALVAWGVVSLVVAVAHDGNGYPGQGQLDRRLPPAGSRLDAFTGQRGSLGAPAGFGRWLEIGGHWVTDAGAAHPLQVGPTQALVTTSGVDLLVHVSVSHAPPGAGIVVRAAGARDQVRLLANGSGRSWSVARVVGSTVTLLGGFDAPTDHVVLRVEVHRDRLVVDVGSGPITIRLPPSMAGTDIGLLAADPSARFDELAYLPIPA
ncbi:MAG: hypothetical protein JWN46_1301 [Acidimicrobiales bacterium]|nr:hypothetical protein [Acidimicrobiales bacterium]